VSNPGEDQRRRANHWRHIVATTLRSFGLDAGARPVARRSADETFGTEPDVSVPGLGLHIKAAPIPWGSVSTYLNHARMDADERGQGGLPVLVRPSPGNPPESAYAIMQLSDFADLAKDAARGRQQGSEATP
jgi:hypothetical protein